ncbi:MAG TPA: hypothetical protein VIT93_04195 [Dehalococcoidia bacterium]
MHRRYGLLPATVVLIALLAAMLPDGPSTVGATTFEPTLDASISDSSPGANADLTYDFQIQAPDANFGNIVAFVPPEFGVATDADVPDGAIVGELRADATLGLLNSACWNPVPVEMTLFEATTDLNASVYGDDGWYDLDGNGLVEFAQRYPPFLTRLFPGLQPIQRMYGQALVAGNWNMVNFLIFEPGTQIPFLPKFDDSLGYPTFAILNDPYLPLPINPVSDFCSPFGTINTTYGVSEDNPQMPGDQGGFALLTNPPAAGTYVASSFVRSLWDADDDGVENNLDPCHYSPDDVWDPRTLATAGDADQDGLPASCDPDDNSWDQDVDGDGFVNRLDFCPFVYDFALDSDADDVGDACDREPFDPSDGGLSHRHTVCTTSLIVIGDGGDDPELPPCPGGPDLPVMDLFSPPPTAGTGTEVDFGVRLTDQPNFTGSLPGATVDFTVTGANPTIGTCTTDAGGYCGFSYVGESLGEDTITADVPEFGLTKTATVSWAEAPENDMFESAMVIDDLPYEGPAITYLASKEEGEVYLCGSYIAGTVWYRYTAPADGMLSLGVQGATGSVFTGESIGSLEAVVCSQGGQQYFFEAEAGTDYHIRVEANPFFDDGSGVTISLSTISGISVGDMNCDGTVSVVDSLIILRLDAGLSVPDCATAYGDVSCDGEVNPIDSIILLWNDANPGLYADHPFPGCLPIGWTG